MIQTWESLINGLQNNGIANGAALASSTTLTKVSPTPDLVLPANFLVPGSSLRVTGSGVLSTTSAPTLLFGVYYGTGLSTALAVTGAITAPSGVTNMVWRFQAEVTVRTGGSSGTAIGFGELKWGLTATTAAEAGMASQAGGSGAISTATIDTTSATAIVLAAQWGTNSASNTLTCASWLVESLA